MKRPKFLRPDRAIELMHHIGTRLMNMHQTNGMQWFILHQDGGPVSEEVAIKIIARADVHALHDGLFPGCSQTFVLTREVDC